MRKVIIEIAQDGTATVEVEGATGPACKDLTRAIEQALGDTTSVTRKREYSAQVRDQRQVVAR